MSRVTILHRDMLSITPHDYYAPEGESLEQMVARVKSLPDGWPRHDCDVICINGHAVPRALWGMVKPRAASKTGVPVEITVHAPPMGGGGTKKNIIGIVATIGLIALSGGVASGAFATLGGTGALSGATGFAANLARLAGAAVMIGGSAILQALAPTPSVPQGQDANGPRQLGSAAADQNVFEPNGPIARVVGTRRVYPGGAIWPLVYFDGENEVAEAIYALAGPHKLEDIRVGDAPIDDVQGVEYETREGWPGLDPLDLIRRYGLTFDDNTPIQKHTVSQGDKGQLESQTIMVEDALPSAKVIATGKGQDEFWMGIQFDRGLDISTDPGAKQLRVPLRLRMRKRGTETWTVLPELHFQAAQLGTRRATIKFVWRDIPVNASAASPQGWVEARRLSPGQAIEPNTDDWVADSYFSTGTGDDYISSTNPATTGVKNVIMGSDEAEFQLDRAVFTPGIYEVEVKRGYAFKNENYDAATYQIGGSVRDPFYYEGAERIFQTQKDLIDDLKLVRYNSVWNSAPVTKGGVAMIAVRARDTRINRISVLASGYVRGFFGQELIENGSFNKDLAGWSSGSSVWRWYNGMARVSTDGSAGGNILQSFDRSVDKEYSFKVITDSGNGINADAIDSTGENTTISLGVSIKDGEFSGNIPAGYDTLSFENNGITISYVDDVHVGDLSNRAWGRWVTTSLSAPHLRDVLIGQLNATPFPEQVIDNDSLVALNDAGWTCNAIIEGKTVADAAKIIAGSGFAQLYQSDRVGVVMDRDRSGDAPIQIFSPENMANFSWSRGYPKMPDGFRATFADIENGYEARQIIHPDGANRTEQVTIEGLVTEASVRKRLQYDLDTARYRAAFYSWDAASSAIKCRRGSLVGIVSDTLSRRVFSGKVVDYELDASGNVISVQMSNEPDMTAEPAWADIDDLNDIQNMALIGAEFGLVISRKGKTATFHNVTVSGNGNDWVDLVAPASLPGLEYGDRVAIGPQGKEYRRLIVIDMKPRSLEEWTIIAVPEANEIWQ